jgi:hypothetical protein
LEFSIQQDVDKDLITLWKRKALLAIGHLLYFDGDLSVSVSLFRNGESIETSKPVVSIRTSNPRS